MPNDVVLLCSDGLTDLVWNDEILEIVRAKPSLKEAARALIELANSRGGHDNITIVLISVPSNFKLVTKRKKGNEWLPWVLGSLAGLLFVIIAGSILTLGLLRRSTNVTFTPTVSPPALVTETPFPTPTESPLPTLPIATQEVLPIAPTYTPWPTNTVTQ